MSFAIAQNSVNSQLSTLNSPLAASSIANDLKLACGGSSEGRPEIGLGYTVKSQADLDTQIKSSFEYSKKPLEQLVLDDTHSADDKQGFGYDKRGNVVLNLGSDTINLATYVNDLKKKGILNGNSVIALFITPGFDERGLQALADKTGLKVVADWDNGQSGVKVYEKGKPSVTAEGSVSTGIGSRSCGGPGGYNPREKEKPL